MTAVATLTGASSGTALDWRAINRRAAHRNVRRLQARIVKAVREKRWGKVKALQHLLTHSFSGKVLAVGRVTENQGKMTPGVDQQVWACPFRCSRHTLRCMLESMEPTREQITPELFQAIVAKATAHGLTVDDYLRQALGLENGDKEELSLSGTPFEDVEEFLGVFDSREQLERPEVARDPFTREVIAKLERQGLKLP